MQVTPQLPTVEHLRVQAAMLGVDPPDIDLEAVLGFLATILPALAEIERALSAEPTPADASIAGETP